MPTLLNIGLYSVPEAARLSGIKTASIHRWLRGYCRDGVDYPAVWERSIEAVNGVHVVTFRDLMELRAMNSFLKAGVTWPTIRKAVEKSVLRHETDHPFSTLRMRTDGRTLFDVDGEHMVEFLTDQVVFSTIVEDYLCDLDFDGDQPSRWWPMGRNKDVVLDPRFNMGAPMISSCCVPTAILAKACRKNPPEDVACWYEVDIEVVELAAEYEGIGFVAA